LRIHLRVSDGVIAAVLSPVLRMIDWPYVEAILEWEQRGPDAAAEHWLVAQGLQLLPMRAGLLLTGGRVAFERAFGIDLEQAEPPVRLAIPDELRQAVASVTIPIPREIYE
jgi:hypothetical protein